MMSGLRNGVVDALVLDAPWVEYMVANECDLFTVGSLVLPVNMVRAALCCLVHSCGCTVDDCCCAYGQFYLDLDAGCERNSAHTTVEPCSIMFTFPYLCASTMWQDLPGLQLPIRCAPLP